MGFGLVRVVEYQAAKMGLTSSDWISSSVQPKCWDSPNANSSFLQFFRVGRGCLKTAFIQTLNSNLFPLWILSMRCGIDERQRNLLPTIDWLDFYLKMIVFEWLDFNSIELIS